MGVADLDWSPGGCVQGLPCPAARLKKVTPGRGPGKGSGRETTYCGPAGTGISPGGVVAGRLEWCVLTDTDISSVAYKTPCNNYREEMIL